MFVVEIVAALTTVIFLRDLVDRRRAALASPSRSSSGCGSRCCSPISPKRSRKAAARPRPSRCARPAPRARPSSLTGAGRDHRLVAGTSLKVGDVVLVEAGDTIPSDGEVIEGVASVNEAAITGESAPVIRESGGDRSAVTGGTQVLSDWIRVRITAAAGLDLHRPHDQAGGRRGAAEDAERDRAQHPARRPHHHLRVRDRDHPELCRLCRRLDLRGGAGGAVRDADSDHDRRAAVGDRHCRHGPPGALQRAGDVGPGGRSRRRRRYAAARQDRHHHARQPPGDRVPAGARRQRAGARGRGAAGLARRRDAGRPLDRGAGQGEIRHPRPRHGRARRQLHSVHGADPHERGRCRRLVGAQGRGRCDPELRQRRRPIRSHRAMRPARCSRR